MDLKEAQQEWATWKYFVMSRSQQQYLAIRQLFSNNQWSPQKSAELSERLALVKTLEPTAQTKRNTYEHLWGYFKKVATEEEKDAFFAKLASLSETEDDALPYLQQLTRKYRIAYLRQCRLITWNQVLADQTRT